MKSAGLRISKFMAYSGGDFYASSKKAFEDIKNDAASQA